MLLGMKKTDTNWLRLGHLTTRLAARLVALREGKIFAGDAERPADDEGVAASHNGRGKLAATDPARSSFRGSGAGSKTSKGGPAPDQQLAHGDRRVAKGLLLPADGRASVNGAPTRTLELQPGVVRNAPDPIGRCSSLHASWYACPYWIREIAASAPRPGRTCGPADCPTLKAGPHNLCCA